MKDRIKSFVPVGMALARIMIVAGLIPNGIRKITTFDTVSAMMGGAPPVMVDGRLFPAQEPLFYFPFPEFFLGCAIIFDILGAVLVIAGYKTRIAAAFMVAYIVLAMSVYHSEITGPQDVIAILRNLPLVGGLIVIAAVGAGRWSIDNYVTTRYRRPA